MRYAALILAGLALGCSNPVLYIHTPDPEQAKEHRLIIRDAGKKMGVRIKVTDVPSDASVEVTFHPADAGVCGVALERIAGFPEHPVGVAKEIYDHVVAGDYKAAAQAAIDCNPRAWSCTNPDALAHELGHVLGLPHKAGTAMNPEVSSEPFTDKQTLIMQAVAVGFAEACGPVQGETTDPREPG